jgi:hypothetical protein
MSRLGPDAAKRARAAADIHDVKWLRRIAPAENSQHPVAQPPEPAQRFRRDAGLGVVSIEFLAHRVIPRTGRPFVVGFRVADGFLGQNRFQILGRYPKNESGKW